MEKQNGYSHVVFTGDIDAAETCVTNFVPQLRDAGLEVQEVKLIGGGELHTSLENFEAGMEQDGITLGIWWSGDQQTAYELFPQLLQELKGADMNVLDSGIQVGTYRNIAVPA